RFLTAALLTQVAWVWACSSHSTQSSKPAPVPTGIPSLSGLDDATRQSIELACVTQNTQGPVAYGSCLNKQINALLSSPGIPSLSGLDDATRQSIELACVTQNTQGPVAYGKCLNKQINALRIYPGIPSLSGIDDATTQSLTPARVTENTHRQVSDGRPPDGCLERRSQYA